MTKQFKEFQSKLEAGENILIISHNRPDGDSAGANLALRLHLLKQGKNVCSACSDPLPKNLEFLPGAEHMQTEFLLEDFDTVVIVDAGAKHLVRFFETYPELNRTRKPIICVDHHYSNDQFGTLNLIDHTETSTTTIIYKFLKFLKAEITPDIATCLLNGIYTDTGSFMHSNTKPETLKHGAELIAAGANFKAISKQNFQTTNISKLKLMGEVLSNVEHNPDGTTIAGVSNALLQKYKADSNDLSGVVDFINSIPNSKYTVLYTEDNKGNVKASLRTQQENINVAEIASQYGGGGHSKAAGFRIPGKLNKNISWSIDDIHSQ